MTFFCKVQASCGVDCPSICIHLCPHDQLQVMHFWQENMISDVEEPLCVKGGPRGRRQRSVREAGGHRGYSLKERKGRILSRR